LPSRNIFQRESAFARGAGCGSTQRRSYYIWMAHCDFHQILWKFAGTQQG